MSRSVRYSSSPLLASKTPVWRSKFIVAAIALGFAMLAARAAHPAFSPRGSLLIRLRSSYAVDRDGLPSAAAPPGPTLRNKPEIVMLDDAGLQCER